MPQSNQLPVRPKKVTLFPEIDQIKISLSLIYSHSQIKKKNKQEYKKAKETREENRISPENRLKQVNFWLPG